MTPKERVDHGFSTAAGVVVIAGGSGTKVEDVNAS